MSEITDFFQKEAQECRSIAANAKQKRDREYWIGLAERWEGLLPEQRSDADLSAVRSLRPTRGTFPKKPKRAA